MNILIYLCLLIISILSLIISYKYLKTLGLSIIYLTMNIISFILTFKIITLSTINANANSVTYITMLISLYLILEKTSKEEAKSLINMTFIINIFTSIMLYIMTYYTQSITDTISINMKNIFFDNSRILIVYPIATLISNYLLIWVYEKMKKIYDNHFIVTVTIYLLVGLVESLIYTLLSYLKILNAKTIIMIILSTYMIRLITTVIYSIFLTITDKKKVLS